MEKANVLSGFCLPGSLILGCAWISLKGRAWVHSNLDDLPHHLNMSWDTKIFLCLVVTYETRKPISFSLTSFSFQKCPPRNVVDCLWCLVMDGSLLIAEIDF